MGQLVNNIIKGFLFLTLTAGGYGMIKDLASRAVDAHKVGLISYSEYTKVLTNHKVK